MSLMPKDSWVCNDCGEDQRDALRAFLHDCPVGDKIEYLDDICALSNKSCPRYYGSMVDGGWVGRKWCTCIEGRCWYDEQKARRVEGLPAIDPESWDGGAQPIKKDTGGDKMIYEDIDYRDLNLSGWMEEVHNTAKEHGWWDSYKSNGPQVHPAIIFLTVDQTLAKLALITSEVSEAVEAVREGACHLEIVDGKPEGVGAELADVVIRVMDLCEALDIDLEECMEVKAKYNRSRPHRHGGKLA